MKTITISQDMLVDRPVRLANMVLDVIAIYIIIFTITFFIALVSQDFVIWVSTLGDFGYNVMGAVMMLTYYTVIEFTTQRSIGKYITGTIVIMEDGSKPALKAVLIRSLCRLIPFEAFSFFREDSRGWHDTISDTYVVNAKKYKSALELQNSFDEIGVVQEL
jgi:uncharacterized RDD family membrane protein YckC